MVQDYNGISIIALVRLGFVLAIVPCVIFKKFRRHS